MNSNKLLLKEKGNLVSDEKGLATITKNFFITARKDLELNEDSKDNFNNLEYILKAFESHQSIEKSKKAINATENFSFCNIKDNEVQKFIMNLYDSIANRVGDIPTDMLQQIVDIDLPVMTQIINMSINNNCYPDDLKLAEVSPVFNKKNDLNKESHRPVSVLSHVPKVFYLMYLNDLDKVTEWLFENYMVLNAGKCHFMCLGKNTENETFTFKDTIMNNSKEEKILGVIIDNRLTFSSHIRELCKKASQKISALSRISNQLNDSEKVLLFNAVVKSQFNYCPLVWMFCSRTSNNMINRVHERALKVILGSTI